MNKALSLRLLGICCLVLLLAGSASSKNPATYHDPGQIGPYAVGFTSFVLIDTTRNTDTGGRPVAVYLWYPVDAADITASTPEAVYPLDPVSGIFPPIMSSDWEAHGFDPAYQEPPVSTQGPFPLVVFSPGWGAAAWSEIFIGTRLASHGMVVAVAYHWGDGFWAWEPLDHLAVAALNRPQDISFMLTALLDMNGTDGNLIHGAINPDQVAAAGFSLGGYAALVLAAGDDSVCDKIIELGYPDTPSETCVPSPPDSRIKAIISLDGSVQGLYFYELARITVPTLGIGEEWSTLEMLYGPEYASQQARLHAASQGHPSYRVDLAEADHMAFINMCQAGDVLYDCGLIDDATRDFFHDYFCSAPIPPEVAQQLITTYMIAFLKANLAHVPGYQHILTPGYALKEPYIEFFVTEKRNPQSIDEDWPDTFIYFMHQPGSEQAQAAKDPDCQLPIFRMRFQR